MLQRHTTPFVTGSNSGRAAWWWQYGEVIPDLTIAGQPAPYPVMNERAVRATAGLLLIVATVAFSQAYFLKNLLLLKIVVPLFLVDFTLRVLTGLAPLSPFGLLGTVLVRKQKPEWVGAAQKRFAWSLGIAIALVMTCLGHLHITGPLPFILCMTCMVLMWMETALGVCVGCAMYQWLVRQGVLHTPAYPPACPGSVCDVPSRASMEQLS